MAMIFDPASQGTRLTSHWQELVMDRQDAARLGAQKPFVAISDEDLRDAAEVLYPVHAVGYNWLQSNLVSAQRLAEEIERITAYYRSKGKRCEGVILITHSMGGLVARAWAGYCRRWARWRPQCTCCARASDRSAPTRRIRRSTHRSCAPDLPARRNFERSR